MALAAALLAAEPVRAQQMRTVSGAEGAVLGQLSNVGSWLGTLAGERDGAVVVGLILTPLPGVDLRGGDVVQAVNGTPVGSLAALRRAYDRLAVGAPVRLAVRRGGRAVEVRFARPDPSRVPRLTVESQTLGGGSSPRRP
jgi:S1-C subfamily serine protease